MPESLKPRCQTLVALSWFGSSRRGENGLLLLFKHVQILSNLSGYPHFKNRWLPTSSWALRPRSYPYQLKTWKEMRKYHAVVIESWKGSPVYAPVFIVCLQEEGGPGQVQPRFHNATLPQLLWEKQRTRTPCHGECDGNILPDFWSALAFLHSLALSGGHCPKPLLPPREIKSANDVSNIWYSHGLLLS